MQEKKLLLKKLSRKKKREKGKSLFLWWLRFRERPGHVRRLGLLAATFARETCDGKQLRRRSSGRVPPGEVIR